MHAPDLFSIRPKRAHETGQNDDSCIHEDSADFARPPDVLSAISLAESKITVQSVSEVVAVESIAKPPLCCEKTLDLDRHQQIEPDGRVLDHTVPEVAGFKFVAVAAWA